MVVVSRWKGAYIECRVKNRKGAHGQVRGGLRRQTIAVEYYRLHGKCKITRYDE